MATKPAKAKPVRAGRPSKFTTALAEAICTRISEGESLRSICADKPMPTKTMVMRWLADPERAKFRDQYACAREAQADKLVEEIISIADEECTMVRSDKHGSRDDDGEGNTEIVFDATAVSRNKLRVDARKWVASKMAPKKYGDKVALTGDGGGPITAETVTRIELVPLQK